MLIESGVDDLSIRIGDIWLGYTLSASLFHLIEKMAQETVLKRLVLGRGLLGVLKSPRTSNQDKTFRVSLTSVWFNAVEC